MRKLDGLPLALATAGGFLGLTHIPVSEYLEHYETSWLSLQEQSPRISSYKDRTIHTTWNLSYDYILKEDVSAAKLLALWAYFDNRDLWYDLLKAGRDAPRCPLEIKDATKIIFEAPDTPSWLLDVLSTKLMFHSAMAKLQKHCLVQRMAESDGYSMHHCVYE